MHFFTEEDLTGRDSFSLEGASAHHLLNVLRVKDGEKVEISDGRGLSYNCVFRGAQEGRANLEIVSRIEENRELPAKISLYQCMIKGDKMSFVIQKAVELGADRIVPVLSGRTMTRPNQKSADHKRERWQKIAEAASEQCGRDMIPQVGEIMPIEEAIAEASGADCFILPYECAKGMQESRRVFSALKAGSEIAVMIGPEGGFEPAEVDQALEAGAEVVSLGRRILRAETAAVTALSWLVYFMEENE